MMAILPLIVIAAAAVLVMVAVAVRRSHAVSAAITLAGLAAAFASLWPAASAAPREVTPLLVVDSYALFYTGLIVAASFAVTLLSYGYFARREGDQDELYILLLIAVLGSAVLVSSSHFVSFFLGLELLSVPLYAMIAYLHTRDLPVEAGIKYLVLAAASASFLLLGIALLYYELGTMELARVAGLLASRTHLDYVVLVPALVLIVTGIGFKLAVVPFHMWTPDVYEGAPAPVTAFVATVSKGAMFGLLLRYFYRTGARGIGPVFVLFAVIAIASMIAGNLLALLQNNVKRILAYSSIAHLGYVLVAFLAAGEMAASAVTFYLVAYIATTLGAFAVVAVLSGPEGDAAEIADYRGLFRRRPWLAGAFTVMLFSLAGIPLTAGFLAKFYVVAAGASAAQWALIIVLVATSGIGLYYYLRIVVALYSASDTPQPAPSPAPSGGAVIAAATAVLLWLGIYPGPMLDWIRAAVRVL
jgi:NADH-quinone oxidoreductase subunit N